MPGVADQIRRTQLRQDQSARQKDMNELLRMVAEGRLHEADERQLETLKLSLELNQLLGNNQQPAQGPIIADDLIAAVKQAIADGIASAPQITGSGETVDSSRPQLKHVSLADLPQDDAEIVISHKDTMTDSIEGEESSDKLEKLRKLKKGS